jgi:hypothetical protein
MLHSLLMFLALVIPLVTTWTTCKCFCRVMQHITVGTPRWTVYCLSPAPAQMPACNWKQCVWHTRKSNGCEHIPGTVPEQLDASFVSKRICQL